MRRHQQFWMITGIFMVFVSLAVLKSGPFPLSWSAIMPCFVLKNKTLMCQIFWNIRVKRWCILGIAGSALAGAGLLLQGLLRNPMTDPGLLGLSSGTGFFLLLGSLYHFSSHMLGLCAVLASVCWVFIGMACLRKTRQDPGGLKLILLGILLNGFFMALTQGLLSLSSDSTLRWYYDWTLFGEWGVSWGLIGGVAVVVIGLLIWGWILSASLDVWQLGQEEAASMGMSRHRLQTQCLLIATGLSAGSVLLMGPIAFIGLLGAHFARSWVGHQHRDVFPAACALGVLLLWIAEVIRASVTSISLPLSLWLTLIGVPSLCVLLLRGRVVWHDE